MTRCIISWFGLGVWALCIASCSADLIRNPNVERWCGDKPCDWQVEGVVERVGTWHPNDYAVSLVSDDATLIQENGKVHDGITDCFDFAMVAKIDRGVDVYLELDFLADGTVEFSQRLPVSKWERRTFRVTAPEWYNKVRFIIRKDGPGLAILAEISAKTADGECTAPPVELLDRPQGAVCRLDAQCADEVVCEAGHCGGCSDDASCDADQTCGLVDVNNARYHVCLAQASSPLGAACDRDRQCASGLCFEGACSECASSEECEGGARCNPALGRPGLERYWPRLCGVAQRLKQSGDVCTDNLDCESSECQGFSVSCEPERDCSREDIPCLSCGPELRLGTCR